MSRILIVYASHYGQTREVAHHICDRLRTRGHEVDTADIADGAPRLTGYDGVILGSRVELGKHAKPILEYVTAHRDELAKMPTAFFSVSMSATDVPASPDPNGYLAKTFRALQWTPTEAAAFGGALPYRRYNVLTRFIMKMISKQAGHTTDTSKNHIFTDFTAVTEFADRFAWHLDERYSVVHL